MKKIFILLMVLLCMIPFATATIDITGITTFDPTNYIYPNGIIYGTDTNVDGSMVRSTHTFYINADNDINADVFYGTMTNGSFFAINDVMQFGSLEFNITQAFTGSGLDIDWYYSVTATNGYWKPLPIIEDQTQNFTQTGIKKIIINSTTMEDDFYGIGPTITYRGYMIMAHVNNVDVVTTAPQIEYMKVNPYAIQIINEETTIEDLETTIANTNILDNVGTYNYLLKKNIYLDNATLNISSRLHLDIGYNGIAGRVGIISDNYKTDSTLNIGGNDSSYTGSSVFQWTPNSHIGRQIKYALNIYNSMWHSSDSNTEIYHAGTTNMYNAILTNNPNQLYVGSGTFEKTSFINTAFYLYSANYNIKSLNLIGASPVVCGWDRHLILKNTDFSQITSAYQISGSVARARYDLINPVGYNNDLLAMKSYANHTEDGHVWEYYEMDLKIHDIYGNSIQNADVTITNGNGDVYSGTTNSSGQIDTKTILVSDTWNDGSASCSSTYIYQDPTNCKYEELYNPITIEIKHSDYLNTKYQNYNLTQKEDWTLTMLPYDFNAIIIKNDATETLVIG